MIVIACALIGSLSGCVRRTVTITSDPSGALVLLNDREVGRTPVEVEFLWYGDYDVRLSLEGHDPLTTVGRARAPLWDTIPLDLAAELSPGTHDVRRAWHFTLIPSVVDDEALRLRALTMRSTVDGLPVPPPLDDDGAVDEPEGDSAGEGVDAVTHDE